jgi:5'-nucleotidase
MRKTVILILAAILVGRFTAAALAEQVTVLYTGETHSMVYPCRCPREPDGGLLRRATMISDLRKQYPEALVLDSGSFFGGGVLDENSQNTELDRLRTEVNLKGMELCRYDAAAIADDEFNFGVDFLQERMASTKITFISSNAAVKGAAMYLTRMSGGVKIGIFGLTPLLARTKAAQVDFREPLTSARETVAVMKAQGCRIIILLTRLEDDAVEDIVNQVPGINIVIGTRNKKSGELFRQIGQTLLLKPSWQGRNLGILTAKIEGENIADFKVESPRLSDSVKDDPQVRKILPQCFADINCNNGGVFGVCREPGTMRASCEFTAAPKVNLTIISPKDCRVCNTADVTAFLKARLPGLVVSNLSYPGKEAEKLITDYKITGLPVYLLGKEVESQKAFRELSKDLVPENGHYLVKPRAAGVAYFLGRPRLKGKLDLFISLFSRESVAVLEAIREFNPAVHFLCAENNGKFEAAKREPEVEESLRSVCVQKYYPDSFWDYIICRAGNLGSAWWEDCVPKGDQAKIKECARGPEGQELLRENIKLNRELGVMFGPAYLQDNYEIFSSEGTPTKSEFAVELDILAQ